MATIRIPGSMDKQIDTIARKTGLSRETIVVEAICDYLTERNDIAEAEKEYEMVLSGKSKVIPLHKLLKMTV